MTGWLDSAFSQNMFWDNICLLLIINFRLTEVGTETPENDIIGNTPKWKLLL